MFTHLKPRNPERIGQLLDLLEEVWNEHPDLRLGQLLESALSIYRQAHGQTFEARADFWNTEEPVWTEALIHFRQTHPPSCGSSETSTAS